MSEDIKFWPNAHGETSWFKRFLSYLNAHDRLSDLSFMSYEHYPYYDGTCQGPWSNLFKEPEILTHIVQVWRDDGLPDVPMFNPKPMPRAEMRPWMFSERCGWAKHFPLSYRRRKSSYYHTALPYSTPHPACSTVGERITCSQLTITGSSNNARPNFCRANADTGMGRAEGRGTPPLQGR